MATTARGPFCGLPTEVLVKRCESILREQARYRQKIQDLDTALEGYRDEITLHRTYLSGVRDGECWIRPTRSTDHGDAGAEKRFTDYQASRCPACGRGHDEPHRDDCTLSPPPSAPTPEPFGEKSWLQPCTNCAKPCYFSANGSAWYHEATLKQPCDGVQGPPFANGASAPTPEPSSARTPPHGICSGCGAWRKTEHHAAVIVAGNCTDPDGGEADEREGLATEFEQRAAWHDDATGPYSRAEHRAAAEAWRSAASEIRAALARLRVVGRDA